MCLLLSHAVLNRRNGELSELLKADVCEREQERVSTESTICAALIASSHITTSEDSDERRMSKRLVRMH